MRRGSSSCSTIPSRRPRTSRRSSTRRRSNPPLFESFPIQMTSGILLLDKPLGLSSNAALQRVRRALRADKAGHVGSLDPLATGMLPICVGEATKIANDILAGQKIYRFTIALGNRTATGDVEGAVVETLPVPAFDRASLDAVLSRFVGRTSQVPPMYSALKRDGQPL